MKQLSTNQQLATGILIASQVHSEQRDKAGEPYILHPLRLMNHFLPNDKKLATIAVMHDTVEDSHNLTIDELRHKGFSDRVLLALTALTHVEGDSYEKYIEKVARNPDATLVKIQDLKHNMDVSRLKSLGDKGLSRQSKYHRAFVKLNAIVGK